MEIKERFFQQRILIKRNLKNDGNYCGVTEEAKFDDEENKFLGVTELPKHHKDRLIRHIEKSSIFSLIFQGFSIYFSIVVLFSIIFYFFDNLNYGVLDQNVGFYDLLYFNFISILTIGYGDYAPLGFGRFFAVLEALIGFGLFGAWIGVAILKITLPAKDSIVFSKYCYYVENEESFVVTFLNTNRLPLVNAEMYSSFKRGRDFKLRPSYKSPYIGKSAWTFAPYKFPIDEIGKLKLFTDDGFKFGINGSYAFANFATAMKYTLDKILVIDSREPLTNDINLRNPKLSSPELHDSFHYKPDGVLNFPEYARYLSDIVYYEVDNGPKVESYDIRMSDLEVISLKLIKVADRYKMECSVKSNIEEI